MRFSPTVNSLAIQPRPGSTLSVYPGVTRKELLRLLAVILLFALFATTFPPLLACAVERGRDQWHSAGVLRPGPVLHHAPTATRCLLDLSRPRCGLRPISVSQHLLVLHVSLLWLWASGTCSRGNARMCCRTGAGISTFSCTIPSDYGLTAWVLMLSAIVLCCLRGGVLSFVCASGLFLLRKYWRAPRLGRLGPVVLIFGVAVVLAGWLGSDALKERYATIWEGKILQDVRLESWTCACQLSEEYPLWGTGRGTYPYVERTKHTEYREGVLYRIGACTQRVPGTAGRRRTGRTADCLGHPRPDGSRRLCAVALHRDDETGALALGAFFALASVVFQSISDLAIHFPAYTVLVTVLWRTSTAWHRCSRTVVVPATCRQRQRLGPVPLAA